MTRIRHDMSRKVGRRRDESTIRIKDILRSVGGCNILMAISTTCPTFKEFL